MGRRGLSLQERNLEPHVRFRMNEHGKVQVLLNMESVCSQLVPGSGSSCKWESVGTENGSLTDVLKLRGTFNEVFKMIKKSMYRLHNDVLEH